jgi:serine O-acetyltransferase
MTSFISIKSDFQAAQARECSQKAYWVQSLETLFCSAGFHSLLLHRLAHFFYELQIPLIPRLISHLNRFLTGIEIHPGAKIGKGVFISGGVGVVIGETTIVGEGTLIYEGVTLGGTGKEQGKRHPTIGKNVVIGAGAKVLGHIFVGDQVRIAAGAVVLQDAPDKSLVVGIPGRTFFDLAEGDRDWQPHLEAKIIHLLLERVKHLEAELKQLKQEDFRINYQFIDQYEDYESFRQESDRIIEEFCDGSGI